MGPGGNNDSSHTNNIRGWSGTGDAANGRTCALKPKLGTVLRNKLMQKEATNNITYYKNSKVNSQKASKTTQSKPKKQIGRQKESTKIQKAMKLVKLLKDLKVKTASITTTKAQPQLKGKKMQELVSKTQC